METRATRRNANATHTSQSIYQERIFFDEFVYNHLPSEEEASIVDDDDEVESTTFEIPLDILLECLNIFGTGGGSAVSASSEAAGKRGGRGRGDDQEDGDARKKAGGALATNWGRGDTTESRMTGMRMTYEGPGYPLTLLL